MLAAIAVSPQRVPYEARFSTAWIVPTASLMRNHLLNTLPVADVLRSERVIKMLKKTPKGIQNRGR
jgi:hypothetical protein